MSTTGQGQEFPVTAEQALLIRRGYRECIAFLRSGGLASAADLLQYQSDVLYGTWAAEPLGIIRGMADVTGRVGR